MPHYKPLQPRSLNKRNKVAAAMSIPSKPIPIPRRDDDSSHHPNDNNNIMTSREATEVYDAATWRMFELITSARLRAARNFHCKVLVDDYRSSLRHDVMTHDDDDDHNAAVTVVAGGNKSSRAQLLQPPLLDVTHHRDRAFSLPEEPPSTAVPIIPTSSSLMDEVFPMDSL